MNTNLKVSIITATYNSSKTIKSTIDSIVAQTYSSFYSVIIDGGSKDDTIEIIKSYAVNNSYISYLSEGDKGIYDAFNKGIAKATGKIIGFVHSDDLLASDEILCLVVRKFEEENVDGVYGDLHYVDAKDPNKVIRNWKSRPFKKTLLKKGWMPAHPTLFLRKEVYEKHGGFDLQYKIAADYDFMVRILKDTELNFVYLPEVITKMRVGGASNRSLKNIILKTQEDYRIIRKHNIGGLGTLFMKNFSKLTQFIN